jgi:integrase/recombinase XerD
MTRKDVWCMVRRRVSDAGIETPIGRYTFRATGITDYLTNGGRIEVAQRNHAPSGPAVDWNRWGAT